MKKKTDDLIKRYKMRKPKPPECRIVLESETRSYTETEWKQIQKNKKKASLWTHLKRLFLGYKVYLK